MVVFFFLMLFNPSSWAECLSLHHNESKLLSDLVQDLNKSNSAFECAQQEIIDPLLDTWKLQSFVISECEKEISCLNYLSKYAAEISTLPQKNFESMHAVQLWGEINKYAGLMRKSPPSLKDLPFKGSSSPLEIYEKLQTAELSQRSINQDERKKIACAALGLIIGPNKGMSFKELLAISKATTAAKVAKAVSSTVHDSPALLKEIDHLKIPQSVLKKFDQWKDKVKSEGLSAVKKIKGYHDEPVKSSPGVRSVRLNEKYRLFYRTNNADEVESIDALMISPHDYRPFEH